MKQRCRLGQVLHGEKTSPLQLGKLVQGYLRLSLPIYKMGLMVMQSSVLSAQGDCWRGRPTVPGMQ